MKTMNDEIYLKTENGGIWEKNPHLAYALYTLVGTIIFFTFVFIMSSFIPITLLVIVSFILFLIILVYLAMMMNQRHNMSKSTAFIKRDGKLYAIQLLYTNKALGTETTRNMVYTPSGSVLQAATFDNNSKVASDVQAHEKELKKRREKAESFVMALDDILKHLENNPKDYQVLSNDKRSKLDNLFRYNVENNGLINIETDNALYMFLILNNPKIIDENKKNFTIRFYNEKNELCNAKFSNCFGNIIKEINKMNH